MWCYIKRPLVVMFITLVMVITAFRLYLPKTLEYIQVEDYAKAKGTVALIEQKNYGIVLTLTCVQTEAGTPVKPRDKLLVYLYSEKSSKNNLFYNSSSENPDYKENKKSETEPDICIGNKVLVCGKAKTFEEPGNPGQFNAYRYYHEQGYAFSVTADSCTVTDNRCFRVRDCLRKFSLRISEVYKRMLPEREAGIVSAMVLGEKSLINEEDREMYQQNGIMHLLAVSGLHVSMISTIILWVISRLPVSFRTGRIVVVICLMTYGIIVGFSVSTIRAIIMILLSIVAEMTGKIYDMISAISLSGIVVLLINPNKLYQSDFLLSFGAVIAIACISPVLCRMVEMPKPVSSIWNALCVSFSVSILTLPVILYFFYDAPLYSVLLNLIVIPLMSILFIMALLCGIAGLFFTGAGLISAGAVHYILVLYGRLCELCFKHVGGLRITGCPEPERIIVYYVILLILLICLIYMKKNIIKHFVFIISFAAMIISISAFKSHDRFTVTVLDVGQGDGIYMETPDGKVIMVDGGSSTESSIAKYRLEPFLLYKGHRRIDLWFVTHMDSDHYCGLEEELARCEISGITIDTIVLPDISDKDSEFTKLLKYRNMVNNVVYLSKGGKYCESGLNISCLHPECGLKTDNKNKYSLVLDVSYNDFNMLLTGDIEGDEEIKMAEDIDNEYDILKVAHHGSKSSTQEEFLTDLQVQTAIISFGKGNKYGHPHKEVIERLNNHNINIMNTVDCGAITIITDGKYIKIEQFRDKKINILACGN